MRLLFIRHGDPDYRHDCLTDVGIREAQALARLAPELDLGTCYVSPLGRAQETAAITLQGFLAQDNTHAPKEITTLDWLQEFPARVDFYDQCSEEDQSELQKAYHFVKDENGRIASHIVWDMYPSYYFSHPEYADPEGWRSSLVARHSSACAAYDRIVRSFDTLLVKYGYEREGNIYRVKKESRETLTFFCHFGVTCVILSHLWNTSPFLTMQSLCMNTTSVTELITEERQQGIAEFRIQRIGDITHLTMAGLQPSWSARFADIYSDLSLRHK